MISPAEFAWVTAAMFLAAFVQGSIGFGLAMVAAPLVLMVDQRFVPAGMIMVSPMLTTLMVVRERHHIKLRRVGWLVLGNLVGTVFAVAALVRLDERLFDIVFAVSVLLAVAISLVGVVPQLTTRNSVMAGWLSGLMGTLTSIGGPPVALFYQNEAGSRVRADLSAYFLVCALFAMIALIAAGKLGRTEALLGLHLVPGLVAGFAFSFLGARLIDRGWVKPAVLALSGVSAVVVLVRTLA